MSPDLISEKKTKATLNTVVIVVVDDDVGVTEAVDTGH